MALAQFTKNGFVYAIFTCDGCGEPFDSPEEAIITFSEFVGHPVNQAIGIYHRVKCDPGSKLQPSSDEFGRFFKHLINYYKLNENRLV